MPFNIDCFQRHAASPATPHYQSLPFDGLRTFVSDNNPSTKTKDNKYHKNCYNLLVNNASMWTVTQRSCTNYTTCPEQYTVTGNNTLPSMNNRRLGIKNPSLACLECNVLFNWQNTTAYKNITLNKDTNHIMNKCYELDKIQEEGELGTFFCLKRAQNEQLGKSDKQGVPNFPKWEN